MGYGMSRQSTEPKSNMISRIFSRTPKPKLVQVKMRAKKSKSALQNSPLGELPPELIQLIATFLPPASAATFSVSCHALNRILGPSHLLVARAQETECSDFLFALAKELPDRIFCYPCKHIHIVDKTHKYLHPDSGRFGGTSPCVKADVKCGAYYGIHPDFSRSIFDMAVKRFRLKLDSTESCQLLCRTRTLFADKCTQQYITDARIVAGSLFVRVQYIIRVPSSQFSDWPENLYFRICSHSGGFARLNNDTTGFALGMGEAHKYLSKAFEQWEFSNSYVQQVRQCSKCRTDYQIDIKSFDAGGVGVFVTKWLDLGEGTKDPKWVQHVFDDTGHVSTQELEYELGSVKAAFESNLPFVFDSLLTEERRKDLLKNSGLVGWPGGVN